MAFPIRKEIPKVYPLAHMYTLHTPTDYFLKLFLNKLGPSFM